MDPRIHAVLGAEELCRAVITANGTGLHVAYIAAGAEPVIARTDDDGCANRGIEIPVVELLLDRLDHVRGQRIARLRPVKRDAADAAVHAELDISTHRAR